MQTLVTVELSLQDLNIIRRALLRAEFPNPEDEKKSEQAFDKVLKAIAGTK
jgi:hypothetical protein